MKQLFVAAALACAGLGAHAQFTNTSGVITDSLSGASWLDMSSTYGMSYVDVAAHLDSTFSGYRIATYEEVSALFTDAGLYLNSGNQTDTNATRRAANQSFFGAFSTRVNGWFYTDHADKPWLPVWAAGALAGNPDYVSFAWTDATAPYVTESSPTVGVWVISAVPEPNTYALILSGLAAVAFAARRRIR